MEECTAAGGSDFKNYTCEDIEMYLSSAVASMHESCAVSQNYYSRKCSCPFVLELQDVHFTEIVAEHKQVLVLFCAQWALGCEKLARIFYDAANILQGVRTGVALATVDGVRNPGVLERFQVRGFPTLKWFENGEPTEYTGGLQAPEIVAWVDMIVDMQGGHRHTPHTHRHLSVVTR